MSLVKTYSMRSWCEKHYKITFNEWQMFDMETENKDKGLIEKILPVCM
jgi:hypothetical protein